MQHLPQLALAASLADLNDGLEAADVYAREFRNQVLDFIATNPPRFGANWALAMDVAIRVVSWLVAWDLFRALGMQFDEQFEDALSGSVLDHATHITEHHEWAEEVHGNHYLANVVGLLFAAAYLPRTPTTDTWLAFATKETLAEIDHQFWSDGGGFEASTCYHRLSAEMAAWAVALLMATPSDRLGALADHRPARFGRARPLAGEPIPVRPMPDGIDRPIPQWLPDRLSKMAEFTRAATKPNGLIAQIGDNDSGRFLRLIPTGESMPAAEATARFANLEEVALESAEYWWENSLDHRTLVETIDALFEEFRAGEPDGRRRSRPARRKPPARRRASAGRNRRLAERRVCAPGVRDPFDRCRPLARSPGPRPRRWRA